jgi:hypothetical protein
MTIHVHLALLLFHCALQNGKGSSGDEESHSRTSAELRTGTSS